MSLMSRLKKGMTIWKGEGTDQPSVSRGQTVSSQAPSDSSAH